VAAAVLVPTPALATPTGLNNIPTADTPGDREIVFQAFADFRDEVHNSYWIGFKGGLRPWNQRLEYGADGRLGDGDPSAAVLQFKYAIAFKELFKSENNLPLAAVGVANLALTSEDRDDIGQPATYLVATQDFDWFRATAGYQFQHQNDAAFFGFDTTFELFDRDFMLRTDYRQIDDQDQWLGSVGFIYFIDEHFALESWASFPFESGEPIFTIKLDVIFKF
jgi:hypothetical protein